VAVSSESVRTVQTGIEALDDLLEGGLRLGSVSAWTGKTGAGLLSVLRASVQHILKQGHRVAVVDGTRSFVASDWLGCVHPTNLWMIRPPDVGRSFAAAEVLARCGVFEVVAVDVGLHVGPTYAERAHLRRAVKEGAVALLLIGAELNGLGGKVVRMTPIDFSLLTHERTLQMSLVRGGVPRTEEVVLDVSSQLVPCRMPTYSSLPDRRPRTKRPSSERG
jgi:hypothetical protein